MGSSDYTTNLIPEEWEPVKVDDSPDKAAGSTVDEVDSRSKVSFIGSDMSDKRCWIPAADIRMLGCGYDGMAFGTTMECSDFTRMAVSIKVPTSYNESGSPRIKFRTDTKKTYLENTEQIYDALYKDTTTSIRRHFAIAFGRVSVSPDLLLKAVENHKQSAKSDHDPWCYEILLPPSSSNSSTSSKLHAPNFNTGTLVLATVDDFAEGSIVNPKRLISVDEQRRVLQDFICIYQHQYERKIIHADILNFHHFLYDGNHVTLVDFARTLFANDRNGGFRQKMQLFQLVALLGNICARLEKKFDVTYATGTSKGNHTVDSMRRTLSSALKPCASIFSKPLPEPLFSGRDFSTERTYQILSNWSGGCRGETNGTIYQGRQ